MVYIGEEAFIQVKFPTHTLQNFLLGPIEAIDQK